MANFCPKCGSSLNEGAKFCASCGSQFQAEPPTTPETIPTAPPTQPVQPVPLPPPGPPQAAWQQPMPGYAAPPPKKSSGKIIGAVIAVIVIVVVIVIAFFLMTGGLPGVGGGDSRFVGTWQATDAYANSFDIIFKSNGDLEMGSMGYSLEVGTWSISNDQLCLELDQSPYGSLGTMCMDFQFSNGGNTLVLTPPIGEGGDPLTLTKA